MMKNKKKRKPRNPKILLTYLLVMFLFIGELFFYAWCRVQSVRIGYEITEARVKMQRLTARQEKLKIELARLRSPRRIAKIAKEQLGLIAPTSGQILLLP
jgi:cell division protein FtsL